MLYLSFFFSACDFGPPINHDILLAQDLLQRQDFSGAVKIYQEILTKIPPVEQKIIILFQMSEIYLQHYNNYPQAISYLKQIIDLTDAPYVIVKTEEKLAEIYFSYLKDYVASIKSYQNLSRFRPKLEKFDLYQFRLAKSLLENRDFEAAEKIFQEIIANRAHEYYGVSYFELGTLYSMQKNWNGAISHWQTYVILENKRDGIINAKFLIANAYETIEDLPKAYNIYYSILGDYPNTQVIQDRLNSIYNRKVAKKR